MFRFFKKSPVVEPEAAEWQFDCIAWLLRNSGGFEDFRHTRLVLPTDEFFPRAGLSEHALAKSIFARVKDYARMGDWPCRLVQQRADVDSRLAPAIMLQDAPRSAAGTFSASRHGVVITYNPAGLGDPAALIATFAHELAHYLTGCFDEEPPGGWENWEYATDVAGVFLGFGVFLINSGFQFSQFTEVGSQGWEARRLGYLSEPELVHAQAIVSHLLEIPPGEVLPHLKPSLRRLYQRAFAEVGERQEVLAELRAVQPRIS